MVLVPVLPMYLVHLYHTVSHQSNVSEQHGNMDPWKHGTLQKLYNKTGREDNILNYQFKENENKVQLILFLI